MRKYIFIAFAIHFLFYISSAHCFFRELVRENALSITMQALAVHKVQNLQEGFLAGTQIKTAQGLRPIELIKLHDIIVGIDHKGQQFQRAVQHIEKKHVEHYVRISIGDQLINAAPDQKFYCPQDSSWIAAKDLTPNHVLLMDEPAHSRLSLIEHIKECAEAYTLTVDGHNLCITPYNLLVHNANVAVRALATIALDYITLARPVSVMIGDGVSLKIFQGKAYNLNSPIEEKTSKSASAAVIKEEQRSNLLQERNYYLSRKQELINLRDQFLQIKKDIENLALQFKSFGLSVTGRVLGCLDTQLSLISNPTSEQELRLNDRQRIELSQLREHELSYIEKQIAEIQKAIGIHFDTLLRQYCLAQEKYENVLDVFRKTFRNANGDSNSTLLACFDAVETTDYYLNYLQENIKTIKLIFNYYRTSAHAQIFQETSNIQDCLNQETVILDYEKTLFQTKSRLARDES